MQIPALVLAEAGGRILVVEDESAIRGLIRKILEQRGYRVLEAATEAEAVELAASGVVLDLLITDLELKGGDGRRVAEAVRQFHRKCLILYISGGICDVEGGQENVLQKPFSPNNLVLAVQRLLQAL